MMQPALRRGSSSSFVATTPQKPGQDPPGAARLHAKPLATEQPLGAAADTPRAAHARRTLTR
jgi:hypothetical protein